jgi:hypothetical protein
MLLDMSQNYQADTRDELKKYGKEGTGKKYMEI